MHAYGLPGRLPRGAAAALAVAVLTAAAVPAARAAPDSFADLAEKVKPAVVNIVAEQGGGPPVAAGPGPRLPALPEDSPFREFFERFFGREFGDPRPGQPPGQPRRGPAVVGVGSGFIIDADGHVVTNYHVVENARQLTVTLASGGSLAAKLIGTDPRTDLALLKVEAGRRLPYVEFGDSSKVRAGDWVLAVGNPFGLGGTVTAGIVSARSRDIPGGLNIPGGALVDYLQIDAPINQGNSGGPTFDASGKVIGVNVAIFSPSGGNVGIGFAIPADTAREVIAALKKDGKVERGWLGVQMQPLTPELAQGFGLEKASGALIAGVEARSPAARAGLTAGDIITAWNGKAVESSRELARMVADTKPGAMVDVGVWRAGRERTVSVKTGEMAERTAAGPRPAQNAGGAAENGAVPGTGLAVTDATPAVRARYGLAGDTDGAVVIRVEPDGPAARTGIRPGDVITRVGDKKVDDAAGVAAAVAKAREEGRGAVVMMIERGDNERFVALKLDKA
jgi:serine protease Do